MQQVACQLRDRSTPPNQGEIEGAGASLARDAAIEASLLNRRALGA